MIAKKNDFVELLQGLFLVKDLKGKKFSLVISKNITLIQDSIKDLEYQGMPSKEFVELATKMKELAQDASEEGKLKMQDLEKENSVLIEERKAQIADVKKQLEVEQELELLFIKEKDLPEDISSEQILALTKIIE